MITFRKLIEGDIEAIAREYVTYFNQIEEANWTIEFARRRLSQLIVRYDALGFILEEAGIDLGFAIGQFVQFDDGLVFELNELLVYLPYHNKGHGSRLLQKMESEAKLQGAFRIQLVAVNDDLHNYFYLNKHGYQNATNNLWRTKSLE